MRTEYKIPKAWIDRFEKLKPVADEAWGFWQSLGKELGFDYKTVIATGTGYKFTALPIGHGKHWCFPAPIKCPKPPFAYKGPMSPTYARDY